MFHKAIKLVIIAEKLISEDICRLIEEEGGKGYTLVPVGGRGLHHFHSTESRATVVDDFTEIRMEVILRERASAEVLGERVMKEYLKDYPGIVFMEEVEILRPERF
jgi:nitrogen regulatory protein PII